jgi:hypothetical protein
MMYRKTGFRSSFCPPNRGSSYEGLFFEFISKESALRRVDFEMGFNKRAQF